MIPGGPHFVRNYSVQILESTYRMNTQLADALSQWDGRTTRVMADLYATQHSAPDFLDTLVGCCADDRSQRGATWVLKHFFERATLELTPAQQDGFFAAWADLVDSDAQLHVMQSLQFVKVPEGHVDAVHDYLTARLASPRKLLRAWAYWGLAQLAHDHAGLRDATRLTLADAFERETAGAVRVRIRRGLVLLG